MGQDPQVSEAWLGVPLWLASMIHTLQISKDGSIRSKVPKLLASNSLTGTIGVIGVGGVQWGYIGIMENKMETTI